MKLELHQLVNTFGQDLKSRYGETIRKLSLHGAFTCPNRDGTLGRGGCTFCNVASFADEGAQIQSIHDQLQSRRNEMSHGSRYLAYFQAYTSTYAEVEVLRTLYEEALASADMVGLCVGTRPDCVPDAVLDLLSGYQQQGYEIWLELGLQSANDATLKRINRGHDFASYVETVKRAQQRGIKICTHLIAGLPGETVADSLETLNKVVEVGVQGIKLHPLHIVAGSTMAKAWEAGRLSVWEMEEYLDAAVSMIRHTPPEVIYHRVTASARKPTLLAPDWCQSRWVAMMAIAERLNQEGAQGSALGRPFSDSLRS